MREFIVEADGGSRGNPGPAGYGSVVIDAATGETLAERAEYIGVATNNVAEYRGLVAGLEAARDLDAGARVRVRMDSKLVVEQMSGRWKIKHPDMKPLAARAARVLPASQVTYEWMPRERNKHADRLANEAMDAGKRGEAWSPSASTAELNARATRSAAPEPTGPPGDATAGAAKARAALAETRATESPGEPAVPYVPRKGRGELRAQPTSTGSRPAATGGTPSPGGEAAIPAVGAEPREGCGERRDQPPAGGTRPAATGGTPSPGGEAAIPAVGAEPREGCGERRDQPPAGGTRPAATGGTPSPGGEAGKAAAGPGDAGRAEKAGDDQRAARNVAATPTTTPAAGWSAPPDMGAPATFVLLRHGETPLTPQKRFSGSGGSDPSLSDVGREQAQRVAAALAARGTIQAIVASPLARTRETAGAVAARLGLDVVIEDGLRETDFGAWEGLTFGEVRERHPEDLNTWLASPEAEPTGGGESFAATAHRMAATRDKLITAYAGRTVLLVTHVTPIKTLVRLALGAPPESLFRMELSAASLSAVAYYGDGNASVRLFNDTSHLR
ncbi:bifunctional RNase H/acid phosphatase [Streptomyces sp. SAS_267]|uniref:bifunctional RNase H/acid phosphatase n=1 Tax=Streptomyces sp. SAS_267 TaxID=3412750 RepID=UPI00403C3AD9